MINNQLGTLFLIWSHWRLLKWPPLFTNFEFQAISDFIRPFILTILTRIPVKSSTQISASIAMQCDPPVEAMEASSDALSNAVSDNRGTVPVASNVASSVATASSVPGARAVANVPGGAGARWGRAG